jgi:hypothetical protein
MWSTGTYVKPKKPADSQFAEGLWGDQTMLVMQSIEKASREKWKRIFKGARHFINAHRKRPSRRAKAQKKASGTNGHAACIEADLQMGSGSSDDSLMP